MTPSKHARKEILEVINEVRTVVAAEGRSTLSKKYDVGRAILRAMDWGLKEDELVEAIYDATGAGREQLRTWADIAGDWREEEFQYARAVATREGVELTQWHLIQLGRIHDRRIRRVELVSAISFRLDQDELRQAVNRHFDQLRLEFSLDEEERDIVQQFVSVPV